MEKFTLTLGDWSHDGHSQMDTFILATDQTIEAVHDAFFSLKGKGLSVDDLCCEYQEDSISLEWFKTHDVDPVKLFNAEISQICSYKDKNQIHMDQNMFLKLFLFVLNRENSSLNLRQEHEMKEFVMLEGVHGMGYGLYSL